MLEGMPRSIGPTLRRHWQSLAPLPGGRWLFSRLLGWIVPYTGGLGATVQKLEPGYCAVTLRERRRVRNHLHSVHAMALANLGEMATGLALLNGLPAGMRGILTGFDIEYRKKSRGQLLAQCRCEPPLELIEQDCTLTAQIRDADDDLTAVVRARWRIGPEPSGRGD